MFELKERGIILSNINYEEFYDEVRQEEKSIREKLQQAQRSFKSIMRSSESGELRKLLKEIDELSVLAEGLKVLSDELRNTVQGFDNRDYFESGEFARQLIENCQKQGVDIQGEAGVYELFPFKLRIDAENQDLYVNRRKVSSARPMKFVQDMKRQIEKYTKSGFNLAQFVNELAAAYDLAVKIKNSDSQAQRKEIDVSLKEVYSYLAPTARARREYDLQMFAFDLSRLYQDLETRTKNGRRFQLGTTRMSGKMIRILDSNGKEEFLATIRFFE